ncbi:MAG TPA: acyltransferase family protein [Burkholderiaceae bacterium]|nr:acyltransferase family protein [Burkholderiaceae bacterium]
MAIDSTSGKSRIDWVDYAKGICIVAVVGMYATGYVEQTMKAQGWMHYFVDFAQPFRMPDFFLISGLFLSRVLDRPWRSYLDTKVVHFFYFYALWVTIKYLAVGSPEPSHEPGGIILDYLSLYVQPHGPLWFIYMLPLFFVTVRLVRSFPVPLVLAAAILLKIADIDTGWKMIDRFGMYFVFCYAGYAFAPWVFRMVDWARSHSRATLFLLAGWFASNLALVSLGVTFQPWVHLLTGFAGAAAIMLLSVMLTRLPWMDWLRYLGEHSIVVYLAFVVPLLIMRKLIANVTLHIDPGTVAAVVIFLSILGAMILYWAVRNTPFRFLFERPAWLKIYRPSRQTMEAGFKQGSESVH